MTVPTHSAWARLTLTIKTEAGDSVGAGVTITAKTRTRPRLLDDEGNSAWELSEVTDDNSQVQFTARTGKLVFFLIDGNDYGRDIPVGFDAVQAHDIVTT